MISSINQLKYCDTSIYGWKANKRIFKGYWPGLVELYRLVIHVHENNAENLWII